ncbi:MAG: hypothetical protein FJX77_03610 [Armatimonadetes bacterium]|nr:hypothetical protein [Armatimonadota bacterium]
MATRHEGMEGLRHANPLRREAALRALIAADDPRVLPALCLALGDPFSDISSLAGRELVRIGAASVIPLCLNLSSDDKLRRLRTIQILGKIADRSARGPLTGCLLDPDPEIRLAAVGALHQVRDPAAAEALSGRLWDMHPMVRSAAAEALRSLGPPAGAVLAALLHAGGARAAGKPGAAALGTGPPPQADAGAYPAEIRSQLVLLLAEIGGPESESALRRALADRDTEVRTVAARSLRAHGWVPGSAVEQVELALAERDWITIRLAGTDAVPVLCALLDRGAGDLRGRILERLVELQDPRAIPSLCRGLRNPDPEVQAGFLRALVAFGSAGVAHLVTQLADESPRARQGAAQALGLLQASEAAAPVCGLLADPNPRVRSAAVAALLGIGSPAVPELRRRLTHSNPIVREGAAWALIPAEDAGAAEDLLRLLNDASAAVRHAAALAIRPLRNPGALEALLRLLEEATPSNRAAAALALGELEAGQAIQPLLRRLDDSDRETRLAVLFALERIGNRVALPALRDRLARPPKGEADREVRARIQAVVAFLESRAGSAETLPLPGAPGVLSGSALPAPGLPPTEPPVGLLASDPAAPPTAAGPGRRPFWQRWGK